jgi:hypothetical protein
VPRVWKQRRHPIFLAEVFARDHFDLDVVLAGQLEDVLAHLAGDRLGKMDQVARAETGGLHRHQQRARMCHVHQRAVEDDAVKTAQVADELVGVTSEQVAAGRRLRTALCRRSHA